MKIIFFLYITFLIMACKPKYEQDTKNYRITEMPPKYSIDSTIVEEENEMKSFENDLDSLKSQIEKL